jgi:hypothetical protein
MWVGCEDGIWLGQASGAFLEAGFGINGVETSGPATTLIYFLSKFGDPNFIVANIDATSKPI